MTGKALGGIWAGLKGGKDVNHGNIFSAKDARSRSCARQPSPCDTSFYEMDKWMNCVDDKQKDLMWFNELAEPKTGYGDEWPRQKLCGVTGTYCITKLVIVLPTFPKTTCKESWFLVSVFYIWYPPRLTGRGSPFPAGKANSKDSWAETQ